MAKRIKYCENHSDIVASDTCSECKKKICYNCRLDGFGHIFCSGQCLTVFVTHEFINGIFGFFRFLFWPITRLKKTTRRGLFELILVMMFLASAYFIWKQSQDIKALQTQATVERALIAAADTSITSEMPEISPPKINQPAEGGMVTTTTVDILGEAENNRIITLSIDKKLIQAVLPEDGKFIFNNIQLSRGVNQLEVRALTEEGKSSTLQTLTLTHARPTVAYNAKDFARGPTQRKEIALTFDGGSIDNAADEILDILKDKKLVCTFFLTGEFIKKYPKTVKRIAGDGHEVGNHTWSHPRLTSFAQNRKHETLQNVNQKLLKEEFEQTASLYKLITSDEMVPLWRAPYGEFNSQILRWAAKAGYRHVSWTVGRGWDESMDTLDWVADKNSSSYRSADEIMAKILNYDKGRSNGSNGVIILMHLGTHRHDDFPHLKLPYIIEGMRQKGYSFVRVSEMIDSEATASDSGNP